MRAGTFALDPAELRPAGAAMLGLAAVLPALPEAAAVPCALRALTGVPCPLCGMTTSVVATVHLDVGAALAANPMGAVAVVAAVAVLVLRPPRLRIPALAAYATLAAMWVFELIRFGVV